MTDEQRQKLVDGLRLWAKEFGEDWMLTLCNEIERLAVENGRLTQALIDKMAEPKFRTVERPPFVIKDAND